MNTINDKMVVILGASSGIGEATVRLLAGKGAKPQCGQSWKGCARNTGWITSNPQSFHRAM